MIPSAIKPYTTIAAICGALLLMTAVGVLGWKLRDGREANREVRELKADFRGVTASIETSRATAARVDIEGAEIRARTQAAQEAIHARTQTGTRPAGPADPDILRNARQAHERAVLAACRVQRTSDCPAAAAATQ